jgi:hypothetical protein
MIGKNLQDSFNGKRLPHMTVPPKHALCLEDRIEYQYFTKAVFGGRQKHLLMI